MRVRPMTIDDVVGAQETWDDAFNTMRAAYGLPVEATDETARRTQTRTISRLQAGSPSMFVSGWHCWKAASATAAHSAS